MDNKISVLNQRIENLQKKCRELRNYANKLKYLGEDLLPEGQPKPEILNMEPGMLPEEHKELKGGEKSREEFYISELEKMKEENSKQKIEIDMLKTKMKKVKDSKNPNISEAEMQQKILEEIQMLKKNPKSGTKGSEDYEGLRKERNDVLEENRKLKQIVIS